MIPHMLEKEEEGEHRVVFLPDATRNLSPDKKRHEQVNFYSSTDDQTRSTNKPRLHSKGVKMLNST